MVLGCTHYPFVAAELRRHTGDDVRFIETGVPVALQTRRLLTAAGTLAPAGDADGAATGRGGVRLMGTGDPAALRAAAIRWLPGSRG